MAIGLISKYFASSIIKRLGGAFSGECLFFLIAYFGVWTTGSYSYDIEGLLTSYTLALFFFGYTVISTLIFSALIETVYKFSKFNFKNI